MKLFSTIFFWHCLAMLAMAQVPQLLKDINPGSGASIPDFEKGAISWNGKIYFAADDGSTGSELWVTDGTAAGTVMVKDINPGASGSYCQNFFPTANFIYFSATDGTHGNELWRTDGTDAGTQMIKDIQTGGGEGVFTSSFTQPRKFFLWNDVLYFNGNDGFNANGIELWKSDGTDAGTMLVKNINTTWMDSRPFDFEEYNGKLYFQAKSADGEELWSTDGTDSGTTQVKDIYVGTTGSNPSNMVSCNGYLLFIAEDNVNGLELWRSDGTDAGTVLVKDINTAPSGSGIPVSSSTEKRLIKIGNKIYFAANDGTNGTELWESDGTNAGTKMVKDASTASPGYIQNFAVLDNVLYYESFDVIHGAEPWRSDGTASGTYLLKDTRPGSVGGFFTSAVIAEAGGAIWFGAAPSLDMGNELWVSDGTAAGTIALAEINPGSSGSYPFQFISLQNMVIFAATGPAGTELYTVALSTAVDEAISNSIQVTPTLSNGQFSLRSTQPLTGLHISLLDAQGHVVKEWRNIASDENLSIDHPTAGLYYIRIMDGEKLAIKKLVIVQ